MAPLWSGLRLLLIASLVMSSQSLLLIQSTFALRQDDNAEHLCVNRDRPDLECDGHCVLVDRLDAHRKHKEESGTDARVPACSGILQYASAGLASEPTNAATRPRAGDPTTRLRTGYPAGIFRPPQAP